MVIYHDKPPTRWLYIMYMMLFAHYLPIINPRNTLEKCHPTPGREATQHAISEGRGQHRDHLCSTGNMGVIGSFLKIGKHLVN